MAGRTAGMDLRTDAVARLAQTAQVAVAAEVLGLELEEPIRLEAEVEVELENDVEDELTAGTAAEGIVFVLADAGTGVGIVGAETVVVWSDEETAAGIVAEEIVLVLVDGETEVGIAVAEKVVEGFDEETVAETVAEAIAAAAAVWRFVAETAGPTAAEYWAGRGVAEIEIEVTVSGYEGK